MLRHLDRLTLATVYFIHLFTGIRISGVPSFTRLRTSTSVLRQFRCSCGRQFCLQNYGKRLSKGNGLNSMQPDWDDKVNDTDDTDFPLSPWLNSVKKKDK